MSKMRMIGLACALLGLCSPAMAAEWPSFRGPEAKGIGTGSPPIRWDVAEGEKILWRKAIPGLGHSSPVVAGDRIFVTTAIGPQEQALKVGLYGEIGSVEEDHEYRFEVLAFDRINGEIVWQKQAHRGVPKVARHPKATHANSTPATDGRHVVAMFGSEGLHTYDIDGKLLWSKDFGVLDSAYFEVPSAQWGFASSPVIHGDKVIVQADVMKGSFLAAFDLATGEQLWKTQREDLPTWSSPTVHVGSRRSQVLVNGFQHMGGYDLETGALIWLMAGGGDIPVPTPVVWEDLVFLTSAHGVPAPLYAVRLDASGDITGSEPGGKGSSLAWSDIKYGAYMQTPLVYGGVLYVCRDNGVLSAYDARSGELAFRERIQAGVGFTASMVAAEGRLYATAETGDVFVLEAGREYEVLAHNELGEESLATPAIVDGVLYFRTRGHLTAIGDRRQESAR